MKHGTVLLGCAWLALAGLGCGAKEGSSGKATFALANATGTSILSGRMSSSGATYVQPTQFKIKLLGVGIKQEQDTTTAPGSAIYVNPDCVREDLESEKDGKKYKYVGFNACNVTDVDTFFDLAKSTDEVNAELNAQQLPILPGSYKYSFLNFCVGGAGTDKNIKFKVPGVTEELEVTYNGCGVDSSEVVPAQAIADGQAVIVTLTYDLSQAVTEDTNLQEQTGCAISSGKRYCINFPAITPSFTVQ